MKEQKPSKDDPMGAQAGNLESFAAALKEYSLRLASADLFERSPPEKGPGQAKLIMERGGHLLTPGDCPISDRACEAAARGLLDIVRNHDPDRKDALDRFEGAFSAGALKAADFVRSAFCNRGSDIVRAMRELDLDEGLTTFLAVYLARPFRACAARSLIRGLDLGDWQRGYCPICGHWPAMGHIHGDSGSRTLWCMHCETLWPYPRIQCPFCANDDPRSLDLIGAESDLSLRAQVCAKCKRYLKEALSAGPPGEFQFDAVYLSSLPLDILASREGYIQESPLIVRYEDPLGEGSPGRDKTAFDHSQSPGAPQSATEDF